MSLFHSITDYSQTQRVVLLVDLNNTDQTPPNFLLSALKTLLLSSSALFSYKLFFSSLSPLLSSSKLPFPSLSSLSFDLASPTFLSLSQSLSQIPPPSAAPSPSRASHVAASLCQLIHDYPWDHHPGTLSPDSNPFFITSNLVLLFSPIPKSATALSEFFSVDLGDECLRHSEIFTRRFRTLFGSVKDAFASRDIHLAWLDTSSGNEGSELGFGFFKDAIRDLGWRFCNIDSIVLGSALVPFGLIYPSIGIPPKFLECSGKRIRVQLNLEIADVDGKPLECKCCDVELAHFDALRRVNSVSKDLLTASCDGNGVVWEKFSDGDAKLCVKAVWKSGKWLEGGCSLSDPILVCEPFGGSEKDGKEDHCQFFEEMVLEMLGVDVCNLASRRSQPIWQILLSFLYKENYCTLISLSNRNGKLFTGLLKPFTVSSALLSIIADEASQDQMISALGRESLDSKAVIKHDLNQSPAILGSQSGPFLSDICADVGTGNKKNKKNVSMLQDLTWSAFCNLALEQFQIDLEDIYFARECYKSKKLKFLKCWLKQTRKSSNCMSAVPNRSSQCDDVPEHVNNRLTEFSQESEQPVKSCASASDYSLTGASRIQDEVALDFCTETLEEFFTGLPLKIQQGLESEEVNLGSLAERLVNSCIYWLYRKHEKDTSSEGQIHVADNASVNTVAVELTKLLLKDPKDLTTACRNSDSSSQAASQGCSEVTMENIVRQYELQILFRMEILQSEVGDSLGEHMTQKFMKQICSLLETIQCHHEGGFFGDWSLDKYVEKIIKSRYCHTIGDVVHRIYAKMDLLLFADADESPDALLNSEDSNHSQRGKLGRDEMSENSRCNDSASAENKSLGVVKIERHISPGVNQEEHTRKLIEAEERRQRARRFASFTTWVPDLQRVWAPKHSRAMKPSSGPPRKMSKRKEPKSSHDVVFETPMTGNKRSCRGGSLSDVKDYHVQETPLCSSVSKALFQGDQAES